MLKQNNNSAFLNRVFLEEALDAIPQPADREDLLRIKSLLFKVTTSMKLQLRCLADPTVIKSSSEEKVSDPVTTVQ